MSEGCILADPQFASADFTVAGYGLAQIMFALNSARGDRSDETLKDAGTDNNAWGITHGKSKSGCRFIGAEKADYMQPHKG